MAGPSVYHRKITQLPISRTKQCLYRNILHRVRNDGRTSFRLETRFSAIDADFGHQYGAPADRESSKHTVARQCRQLLH